MSRRLLIPLVLLFLVVLVTAVLTLGGSPPAEDTARGASRAQRAAAPPPSSLGSPGGGASEALPPPAEEVLPVPQCWEGLLTLDQHGSFEDLRVALANAAGPNNNLLATYLQERLAERVGDDALAALEVIHWAEKSDWPGHFLDALKGTPAIQDPRVAQRLLDLGVDAKAPMALRRASLEALETQHRLSPEAMSRLKALSLDENMDELAWLSTRTLGRVMKEDFERTGTFQPYWEELLDISQKTHETAVKLLALEMPSYSNPLIEGSSLDVLGTVLQKDPDRMVREMAAFRLGLTAEPDKALEAFKAAFPLEQELCVRWAIFRFAVRAAGEKALPLLQQFAAQDERLAPDYEDFKKLYAEGNTDFARIWHGKPERIQCHDEEGEP